MCRRMEFPIIDVGVSLHYSAKIAGVAVGANLVGLIIDRAGQQTAQK